MMLCSSLIEKDSLAWTHLGCPCRGLEHCISLVSSLLLSSSVQLIIIQAVPVIGLLFIAMGYVGSTHVQLYSGAMACFV